MRTTLAVLAGLLIGPVAWPPILAGEPAPLAGAGRAAARNSVSHSNGGAAKRSAGRDDRASSNVGAASTVGSLQPDAQNTKKTQTAVFAGGCFWCTELAFEQLAGVADVESGYCGGTRATATYDKVHRGTTGHAEAIRVTYDPTKISYEQLLDAFFDAHDPTQWNRQGEDDVGRQFRSAIFFASDEQKKQAEAKINELQRKKVYPRRIVTRLELLSAFYPAEDFHQDFARKTPLLPYIQDHAIPKACNVRIKHPELIEPGR